MDLFIRLQNGLPFEHPIFGDNFRQAFPDVDVNNLPPEFARFERIERPTLGPYEVFTSDTPTYEMIDGVCKDVWHTRPMRDGEKAEKQQAVIASFNAREQAENWSAWTFDEATCTMVPPIPRPAADQTKLNAGIFTMWCGADSNWKDTPAKPVDDNQYNFDFLAWQWVQAVN